LTLIFNKGSAGRRGTALPGDDVKREDAIQKELRRSQDAPLPEVSELEAIRHFVNLSRKNLAIETSFYPLGSCTMKYNPRFHEDIAAMADFSGLHPILPRLKGGEEHVQGALALLYESQRLYSAILGFADFTLQPLAGAHGEFTGLMLIAAYHRETAEGGGERDTILIPDSAHGTNPASATLAGFKTSEVRTDKFGNVDMKGLEKSLGNHVAGLMLTCPNTLGLYDPNVRVINEMIHEAGGLIYADGANLNALLGRLRPGDLGFDIMHLNLHKTFSTPHGGGGPGAGPVGVSEKLVPMLPVPRVVQRSDGSYRLDSTFEQSIGHVAPFYGNFAVILRAYAYLLTLGKEGLIRVSENAIINANYVRVQLKDYYQPAFDRVCLHECVLSARKIAEKGVRAVDVAKALIDRGFHPPTVYFPLIVEEALMIEPTETESKETLDAFIAAMIEIAERAESDPESLHRAPETTPVGRLDETEAARHPNLASLPRPFSEK
jgi:glycine dehydrogenase subunit 2